MQPVYGLRSLFSYHDPLAGPRDPSYCASPALFCVAFFPVFFFNLWIVLVVNIAL